MDDDDESLQVKVYIMDILIQILQRLLIVNFTLITNNVRSDWNKSYYLSEDPFLYRDINGYFHIIWHNITVDNTYYGDGNPTTGGFGGHS